MHKGGDEMSQIWRKSNWKTSYVIKLYADGVGAPEVDGDAVLVRNHYAEDKTVFFWQDSCYTTLGTVGQPCPNHAENTGMKTLE